MKKLILIALICNLYTVTHAKNKNELRTAKVKVSISTSDIINIQAKHTELTIETWDKNEVSIEATVRYDGNMVKRIQIFLDEFEELVKKNVTKQAGVLNIDTYLDRLDTRRASNTSNLLGKIAGVFVVVYGEEKLKISYKIKVPATNEYVIASSYKDVNLIGNFDKMDFTQYSGDLNAGSIKSAKMNLKYGSAHIKHVENGEMEIYQQNLKIDTLRTLNINAKYFALELKNVLKINAHSFESDFEIESIKELYGEFKYGEINISDKLDLANFIFYEMKIQADEIGAIKLEKSKYSKFRFNKVGSIVFNKSYEDKIRIGSLGSFISHESKYSDHTIEVLEEEVNLNTYEGQLTIGRLGSNATKIVLEGRYLDTTIGTENSSFILTTRGKYGEIQFDESNIETKHYIKDNGRLDIELQSKGKLVSPIRISVNGYEMDVILN